MINIATLTESEIKQLCDMPPNQTGVIASFFIASTHLSSFLTLLAIMVPSVQDPGTLVDPSFEYMQSFSIYILSGLVLSSILAFLILSNF